MSINEIRDWFTYTKSFTFTAVNQILTDTVPIQADADFVLVKIMHTCTAEFGTSNTLACGTLISLKDQADGRDLMDGGVPLDSISGRGQLPFILPYPHRFKRNNSITVTLTNKTSTGAFGMTINFSGYKTWPIRKG